MSAVPAGASPDIGETTPPVLAGSGGGAEPDQKTAEGLEEPPGKPVPTCPPACSGPAPVPKVNAGTGASQAPKSAPAVEGTASEAPPRGRCAAVNPAAVSEAVGIIAPGTGSP